jgi:hypothetical protein
VKGTTWLKVFANRIPRKILGTKEKVTGEWTELLNEGLHTKAI